MNTDYKQQKLLLSLFVIILTALLASMSVPPSSVNATPILSFWDVVTAPVKTVGDLITKITGIQSTIDMSEEAINSAVDNAGDEARETVRLAGEDIRKSLEKLRADNEKTIILLSEEYKDNLDITIDSLDATTSRKLREIEDAVMRVNDVLEKDILLLKESSIEVIDEAGNEINDVLNQASLQIQDNTTQLETSLKNVVVVGGETAVYVVNEFYNNLISVISIVMLGIGILLFIFLFFTRRIPSGLSAPVVTVFIAVFLAGFGSLLAFAEARAFVLRSTQLGLAKRLEVSKETSIVYVTPLTLVNDEVQVIKIRGRYLTPDGRSPIVTLGGQVVPLIGAHDTEITVNVESIDLNAIDISALTLVLDWGNEKSLSVYVQITPTRTPTPTPNLTATAEFNMAEQTRQAVVTLTAVAIDNPLVSFTVNATEINLGSCVLLQWNAPNVTSVTLEENPVANQGEQEACPTSTQTFRLRFVKLNGSADSQTITVTVRPTPVPTIPAPTATATLDWSQGPCGLPNPPSRCIGGGDLFPIRTRLPSE